MGRFLPLAFSLSLSFAGSLLARETPRVALMFDDGPTAEHMEAFLELFRREEVVVTFSFVGQTVQKHPALAQQALAAGHEVANHSFAHLAASKLTPAEVRAEVRQAQAVFTQTLGADRVRWYWPPYIDISPELERQVKEAGLRLYRPTALVGTEDYRTDVPAEAIYQKATTGVTDGCLILFHEWRAETLQVMPRILAELKRQGFAFETISAQRQRHPASAD